MKLKILHGLISINYKYVMRYVTRQKVSKPICYTGSTLTRAWTMMHLLKAFGFNSLAWISTETQMVSNTEFKSLLPISIRK